jgi:hypothetical protein
VQVAAVAQQMPITTPRRLQMLWDAGGAAKKLKIELKSELFFFFPWYRFGETDPKYYEFTLPKSYVYTVSTLTMRGWSDTPTTGASRCAFIRYIFLCQFLLKILGYFVTVYLWEEL